MTIVTGICTEAFLSPAAATLTLPALAAATVVAVLAISLSARGGHAPLGEIGLWHAGIVGAYAVIPLVAFAYKEGRFSSNNDFRLFLAQPSPAEVARVGWYYTLYLLAFVAAYSFARSGAQASERLVAPALDRRTVVLAATLWVGARTLTLALAAYFIVGGDSYLDSYLAVSKLTVGVRQGLRAVSELQFVFSLVVLTGILARFPRHRWVVLAWLAAEAVFVVSRGGARTGLAVMVVASVVVYHECVKPLRWTLVGPMALVAVAGLLLLGASRSGELELAAPGAPVKNAGEFEALFANAFDMLALREQGRLPRIPLQLRLADLLAIFPSQVLPFEKMDHSTWYLKSYYPWIADSGGGLAFGVVPQSMLGWGEPELLLRGTLLGLVLGWGQRVYRRYPSRLWVFVAYLWLTVWSYQSFRATSAMPFATFAQFFLPAVVAVEALRLVVLRRAPAGSGGSR